MTFWLIMLTFFISIFYYGLSPRSDKVKLEQPIGEAAVVSLVSLHQGAKTYALQRMMGADYEQSYPGSSPAFRVFPSGLIKKLRPMRGLTDSNLISDATLENGTDDEHFVSVFACVNPDRNDRLMSDCVREADKYIVTYGFQQKNWSETVKQKEYWRTAISSLTYNSNECGTLLKSDDLATPSVEYAIDTPFSATQTTDTLVDGIEQPRTRLKQIVPPAITDKMGELLGEENLQDMLICLTKWQMPYEQDGLKLHLDAVNNTGSGHETNRSGWKNLGNDHSLYGQIYGNPSWTNGGLTLDGEADYVSSQIVQSSLGSNIITISVVVKFADSEAAERGALWGSPAVSGVKFIGGEPIGDGDSKKLKFGIMGAENNFEVSVNEFLALNKKTTNEQAQTKTTRPIQVTYIVSLSATENAAWHVLYIDGKEVGRQSALKLKSTIGDFAQSVIEFGRVNGSSKTFKGTFYNIKVYDQSLVKRGCKLKTITADEADSTTHSEGDKVCSGEYIITDKRRLNRNISWDRRRYGIKAELSAGKISRYPTSTSE